jgi:hypothetical protein
VILRPRGFSEPPFDLNMSNPEREGEPYSPGFAARQHQYQVPSKGLAASRAGFSVN